MNIYDRKLENILAEYNINKSFNNNADKIHNVLMDLFKSKCEGKRTALWGAGRKNEENSHAAVILKKYTTYIQTMHCIIDSLPGLWGDTFMGYSIISPNDIQKEKIELIIISSKVQSDSIRNDIERLSPGCEVIDIYAELEKRGLKVYHKFYEESSIYTTIFKIRSDYEKEGNFGRSSVLLRDLIGAYLSIRDFEYAFKFIDEYVDKKLDDFNQIINLKKDIESIIQEVKKKNKNKKDDILIMFVDSLRAMDVFEKADDGYEAKMLKSYLNKACVFTNAKSTGVTTYESMISVIKEKLPYEQNVYKNNIMFEFEEFELLQVVKEMGYDIRFYISQGYQIIKECEDITYTKQVYMSEKLWSVASDMAAGEKKTFNFIYFPYEMHFPLICGYHEKEPQISGFVDVGVKDTNAFVPRQLEECKKYVDMQMEFYNTLFNDDILMALFSDHSQVIYDEAEQKPYFMYYNNQDRCINITFFIKGFGIKQQWNEALVSLYDFNYILKNAVKKKDIHTRNNEIVRYQYYKIHYKKLRDYAGENGLEDYIDGINCFSSNDYIYIVTGTGKEEVYNKKDITKNIMGTKDGRAFADKVKNLYSIGFPEFFDEE